MRKVVLILLVVMAIPLCAAAALEPAATPVGVESVTQVSTSLEVAAAVSCSGSCGGGRTWTWTCPAGYQCWLNCTRNPPTYCYKPRPLAMEDIFGSDVAYSDTSETGN